LFVCLENKFPIIDLQSAFNWSTVPVPYSHPCPCDDQMPHNIYTSPYRKSTSSSLWLQPYAVASAWFCLLLQVECRKAILLVHFLAQDNGHYPNFVRINTAHSYNSLNLNIIIVWWQNCGI